MAPGHHQGGCNDSSELVKGERVWIYTYQPQKSIRVKKRLPRTRYLPDTLKTCIDNSKWWANCRRPRGHGAPSPRHLAFGVFATDFGSLLVSRANPNAFLDHVDDILSGHGIQERNVVR